MPKSKMSIENVTAEVWLKKLLICHDLAVF